jgi:predicted ATP-binding protein involved in virulence
MSDPLPSIRINSLKLQNFRCFREIGITFDPQLTVIVAPNGGGKTAILDAVAVSWRLFVDAMLTKPGSTGFDHSDIRQELSPSQTMEPILPTSLIAKGLVGQQSDSLAGLESEESWARKLNSIRPKAKTSYVDATVLKRFADDLRKQLQSEVTNKGGISPTFPIIAYYGTGRLFGAHKLTKRKKEQANRPTSRYNGYEDCLSSSSRYKFFVDWFERFSREAQDEIATGKPSRQQSASKLRAVKNAVDFVLKPSGWHSLKWDFAQGIITAEHPEHGSLPVDALSDGVRNMIGLVADIAHRAVRLNPQLNEKAATETPGVVLIDEVDMHLHPEWQQLVLKALKDAFPLIQFIVTTHSPQVVSTAHRENIRMLVQTSSGEWEARIPERNPYAHANSVALETVMGGHAYPPNETVDMLREYQRLVGNDEHDSTEALKLRTALEGKWGKTDPELALLDVTIRKNETLRRLRSQKA